MDRLLASPHYGERWARFWLDVARFGEDDVRSLNQNPRGYYPYPNAYLYRDWVIQAFNDDMPLDMIVKAQIAGDLMDPKIRHKTLGGTGFLGLGPWYFDTAVAEVTRPDERHDRVDAITRGFLGLTVACARCHDHKYDPIPTTDYYSLAGVFLNTSYRDYPMAPKAVVEEHLRNQELVNKKQALVSDVERKLSEGLAQSLVHQASNYLMGVWEATNSRNKKELAEIVESRRLDYEILQRWIAYMEKPTNWYSFKAPWQAMMKSGGSAREAQKLADGFQANMVRVMLAKKDLDVENEIIGNKALKGTVPQRRPQKPSDFKTNEQYCGGCDIQYKRMPDEDINFYGNISEGNWSSVRP